ncbi:hypothetical protein [Streptomyces zagrosensis]|uniref:Uncharacterized protein n=1 Tax=Streptomyces zagrosensis TaxID=1042984 RepID=A0A7W9Q6J0_9ACTN|nr:hypothetical protein [Streptomyces zagrosensis]MBB5934480.1 hypothetical protein [Streptomyces zagrosensis]
MTGHHLTTAELLNGAREMADSGRPALARLLAEEAADHTANPTEAARILRHFPGPTPRQEN